MSEEELKIESETYTCIIPMYNEYPRVLSVLEATSKLKEINEVICVDDGSNVDNSTEIKQKYPNLVLIRHDTNKGKATAVATGLEIAKGRNIILFDADIKNLYVDEITAAINIYKRNHLDCLLLCTKPVNVLDHLARIFIRLPHCVTGSRIISAENLKKSLNIYHPKRYQLEIAQNQYLMTEGKKVGYTNISAVDIFKAEKVGIIKGIVNEYKMWKQIFQFGGILFNLKQIAFFARKKY